MREDRRPQPTSKWLSCTRIRSKRPVMWEKGLAVSYSWNGNLLKVCVIEALDHIMNEDRPDIVVRKSSHIACDSSAGEEEECWVFKTFFMFHSLQNLPSFLSEKTPTFRLIHCTAFKMYVYKTVAGQYGKTFINITSFQSLPAKKAAKSFHPWDGNGLRSLRIS